MNSKEIKYLFLILVIFIAACVETDIYLPAFPDMMKWFSATESSIQGLLTWNFAGICVAGPLYGPISDAFGRKRPLLWALCLFLVGSLITLFAQTLDQMLWGRILQGLGSGGCFTLGTAVIFDAFQKDRAVAALNNLSTMIPIVMAAAPLLGGFLNHSFGFRSNFLAIVILVLMSLAVCMFFFDETLPKEKRVPFQLRSITRDFRTALGSLAIWQITLVISLIFGAYIAFLSGSSVLFVVEFGMSKAVFPFIQAAVLAGWLAGSLLLNRSLARWGGSKIKQIGILFSVAGALLLLLTTLFSPRDPYFLTSGMVLFAFGANWICGLYFPEAMEIFPHMKGIVASLLTSARLLIAALVVGLSSTLYNATIYPLTAITVGTILLTLPMLYFYEKKNRNKVPSTETFNPHP